MFRDQSNSQKKMQYFTMGFENMPKFMEHSWIKFQKFTEISLALFQYYMNVNY